MPDKYLIDLAKERTQGRWTKNKHRDGTWEVLADGGLSGATPVCTLNSEFSAAERNADLIELAPRLLDVVLQDHEKKARMADMLASHPDVVKWTPRGIGSNWNIPDLRTGEDDGKLHPDCSGFVASKEAGEKAVRIFGGNAYLDYRPSEPNWVQVKVSCDETTLNKLIDLVEANANYLTPKIVKEALQTY